MPARQAISAADSVDRPHGCRQAFLKSWVLCRLAQSVDRPTDRPIGLSAAFGLWVIFNLDSEFVSDPNLE